jgi:hypothetical protein
MLNSTATLKVNRNVAERIYRDPVHNIIRIRTDTDEGRLLVRLIDAREFQRLRRIKQLGLALYTYQGAEHSRFRPLARRASPHDTRARPLARKPQARSG